MFEKSRLLSKILILSFALASLTSCKKPAGERSLGYIIGDTNDIKPYHSADVTKTERDAFKSTVLISTILVTKKRKFCSGSLISTDGSNDPATLRLLTNFHCFATTDEDGKVAEDFLPEACVNTTVYFNFTIDDPDKATERPCKEGSLSGDFAGDVALFEIEGGVPDSAVPFELWSDESVPKDRAAFLIHHPDVEANFTTVGQNPVSLPAAAITKDDCQTLGDFTADEWPLDSTLPFSFKHSCDLQHGSSGSALLDELTGRLLGVNWGGIEIKYKKGKETVNAATSAYYVKAFINGNTKQIVDSSRRKEADAEKKRKEEASKKSSLNAVTKSCGVLAMPTSVSFPLFHWWLLIVLPVLVGLWTRQQH